MYTLKDYLYYYKNTSLEEVNINEIDILLFSVLSYLPIKSFSNELDLTGFINYVNKTVNKNDYSKMGKIAYEILNSIKGSKRYKSLRVKNFINIKNESVQFGACIFYFGTNSIISYKGTDGSVIGWFENFRLGYSYPTNTQLMAIDYLNENVKFKDKNIYICGHSKGGNLALVSSMEANNNIFKKIKKIYNFDGPGLLKEEFNSFKFKKIKDKLVTIVPSSSVVGVLLNMDNYSTVESNNTFVYEHYPTSWEVFGNYFIPGKLSSMSVKLHESTTTNLESLEKDKVEEVFETLIKSINMKYDEHFDFNVNDILNILKNMNNVNEEVKRYLTKILKTLIIENKMTNN